MMKTASLSLIAALGLAALTVRPSLAKCSPDSVQVGAVCMDKYEASVWQVPNPTTTNKGLVKKIQKGKATLADLNSGATRVEASPYPCNANGNDCMDKIYAVSIAGVKPSVDVTYYQCQQACANSHKRLPDNGEWQMAAAGTPDKNKPDGCNMFPEFIFNLVPAGSRSGCHSAWGAFDMVGNVWEYVADMYPLSALGICPDDGFTDDQRCIGGGGGPGPAVLVRGGASGQGDLAGVFAIKTDSPYLNSSGNGFRCAR